MFNIDQVEGVNFKTDNSEPAKCNNPVEICEEIINSMPQRPEIRIGGNNASYNPALDIVRMPHMKYFLSSVHYYSTLFHEVVHSTGHKSRLNRFKEGEAAAKFGDEQYSKEELTAELGAAYLCNVAGIQNEASKKNHAGYLKSWIEVLSSDTTMIIYAAQRAYKATAFILNQKEEQHESPEYSLQTAG